MSNKKSTSSDKYEVVGEFVSIYVRKCTWYVNYQFGGKQVRRSLKTRSKKEARRRALVIEKEILTNEHKHLKKSPLIEDVIGVYMTHLQSEGRSSKTIGKYKFCFDLLLEIASRRKAQRVSSIDVALIDQFRSERVAGSKDRKPARPKTVHNDTVTIRQLVNFALKRGLISEDSLKSLTIKKPKRTPQPCWTRNEVERILNESKPPHKRPLIFLAETGTRVSEAKWVTWNDVDFNQRLVYIRPKDGWKPKSGDQRVIPLSDRLLGMLREMPRRGDWVFTARTSRRHPKPDRQISERRLLQHLKRVLNRLGLTGHLHTFRHSFISYAACEGVPERVLRAWIGHVDREILDWYFHLADAQSQEAMKRLSDAARRDDTERK